MPSFFVLAVLLAARVYGQPSQFEELGRKALAAAQAGQYQEAVKVCRLGLLGRPTTVEGRVVLGQALLALKRYDEVLAEMRVALELDHTSLTAQVLKAEALLRKGDAHGAADVLNRVRSQAPTDPRIAGLLDQLGPHVGELHHARDAVEPLSRVEAAA